MKISEGSPSETPTSSQELVTSVPCPASTSNAGLSPNGADVPSKKPRAGKTDEGGFYWTRLTKIHFFRNGRSTCPQKFLFFHATQRLTDAQTEACGMGNVCQKCWQARQRELAKAALIGTSPTATLLPADQTGHSATSPEFSDGKDTDPLGLTNKDGGGNTESDVR